MLCWKPYPSLHTNSRLQRRRSKIRGVKCDHAINKLVEYSLVRELGRLDAPGRPILLGTTEEFLRCFGVQDLESLPVPDPVQIEDFKAEAEEEIQLKLDV